MKSHRLKREYDAASASFNVDYVAAARDMNPYFVSPHAIQSPLSAMRYTAHRLLNDQTFCPGGSMLPDDPRRVRARDATDADIPALTAMKGAGTEIIHCDRLRDAQHTGFRYLVLLVDTELIGFACLIGRRPSYWSDADDVEHLPQIVDLQVRESHRSKGYGATFVRALERIAAAAGNNHLYVSVDPINNPRADAFYQRLGYQSEQSAPYRKAWEFRDSQGNVQSGEDWLLDLVKKLSQAAG